MDEAYRQYLTDVHAVTNWPPATPGTISLGDLTTLVLDGWQLVRPQRPLTVEGARQAWVALWEPTPRREGVVIRTDVVDAAGPEEARAQLVVFLGEMQSAAVGRKADVAIGDLAFGPPGESSLLFQRANVVVWIRNAERETVPVTAIAEQLDRRLRALLS